ncbi:spore cortex biosynthesis protein YabQ [Paenibacillus sp. 481]|uniref:spore cortex biosynthesis protein YabQ n=1 Tax=Paenibacillus sp. 481 TaxID=2835869 RepID=UPI001E4EDD02|nr:spore cortex biosynthesis protein YabQ [Paenibacillus sp. 481]UHA75319.1 spore cortex biosynthesis protein YabQ [Paenibacillus sp. 481]
MSLQTQWMTVLLMIVSGLTLGMVFDGYRVVAGQFKFPRWTIPLLDILYWLGATLFVFEMLIKGNQGELRFYVFVGLVMGAWLYVILFSRLTVGIVTLLVRIVLGVYRVVKRCLYVLIVMPLKGLWLLIKAASRFLLTVAIFICKIVLQCLRPLWLLLVWLFRPLVMPLWNRFGMTKRMVRIKEFAYVTARKLFMRARQVKTALARAIKRLRISSLFRRKS